ncbi:homoserine dehydrogenase [Evansella cellulosilytica]|uniref:Homoserine dehydrogenase n=1 Tax=Evansella cellulosilytica (strain ATCC 21833 / DSM 2522 / FERM P-1141 / JCM 9156 / N-4) TaxID=649639 RepID=E6U1V2_EVAC2|nr:homoserine dehydrogenase [Evansella cellulosilytica]ADU31599.1 Homoserine dehydrogenase [Evansella cellulosilytica DSM 2522]
MTTKIAFIGFGGVGQTLAKLLYEKKDEFFKKYDLDFEVVAVSDVMKGSLYNPNGLNVSRLIETINKTGNLKAYSDESGLVRGMDSLETIKKSNADVIVEVTFTDVETGQPAIDHCKAAFKEGKSVVTTNKGPVALAYRELSKLAKENNAYWGFEGTVMSGTPALRLPLVTLAGNKIKEIRGILNGTTNYMITEMEKGCSYEEALKKAQNLGYAEADPTSDVDGFDARYKATILANYVMNTELKANDIPCVGIRNITNEKVSEALRENKVWRLIAKIKGDENGQVKASVQPELIEINDPLAGVSGATNAIVYECDLAGSIMLTGPGAGLTETAYSLLIDLLHFKNQ